MKHCSRDPDQGDRDNGFREQLIVATCYLLSPPGQEPLNRHGLFACRRCHQYFTGYDAA